MNITSTRLGRYSQSQFKASPNPTQTAQPTRAMGENPDTVTFSASTDNGFDKFLTGLMVTGSGATLGIAGAMMTGNSAMVPIGIGMGIFASIGLLS